MLTADRLREVLSYDPETGVFTWKVNKGESRKGSVAGTPDPKGYVIIGIDRKTYKAHRLAWLYMHGVWPTHQIDHDNGIKFDNRFSNLLDATALQNQRNQSRARKHSGSGVRGVHYDTRYGTFSAYICVGRLYTHLGSYTTIEEATLVRQEAERKRNSWE